MIRAGIIMLDMERKARVAWHNWLGHMADIVSDKI